MVFAISRKIVAISMIATACNTTGFGPHNKKVQFTGDTSLSSGIYGLKECSIKQSLGYLEVLEAQGKGRTTHFCLVDTLEKGAMAYLYVQLDMRMKFCADYREITYELSEGFLEHRQIGENCIFVNE
jgi:predicted small secreted protein